MSVLTVPTLRPEPRAEAPTTRLKVEFEATREATFFRVEGAFSDIGSVNAAVQHAQAVAGQRTQAAVDKAAAALAAESKDT